MKNKDIKDFLTGKFGKETLLESLRFKNNVLYHGINIRNAVEAFESGKLEPRTHQRYWTDGRQLRDDHKDYQESGWMYGWSTSRDKFLAGTFGGVLMVLDKDKIKEDFKIQPLSWSYRLAQGSQYFKKEREDFIISHKNPLPLDNGKLLDVYHDYIDSLPENEPSPYEDRYEFHRLHNMKPKNMDLNKVLKEFYVSKVHAEIYDKTPELEKIMSHPLFKGVFDGDGAYEKMKQSNSDSYKAKRLKM